MNSTTSCLGIPRIRKAMFIAIGLLILTPFLWSAGLGAPTQNDSFRVTRLPGQTVVEVVPPGPRSARDFIVEFRTEPLAARVGAATKRPETYQAGFARFRQDLANLSSSNSSSSPSVRHEYFRVFHGASVRLQTSEADAILRLPYVKAVHEDTIVTVCSLGDTVVTSEDTTRISRIGADRFWNERNNRGENVVVAVIDTGIDYMHPALGSGLGPDFKVIGGWDFVDDDGDPMDDNGHGTHVAGIVAGDGEGVIGVAPAARLLAYRVLDSKGFGVESDVIAALELVVDPNQDGDLSDRADIANLSLAGPGDANSPSSIAADHAVTAGVVVVLAAGNEGGGQTVGSPGSSRLSITVGNSDAEDRVVSFSSRGPSFPDLGLKPEIVAPGTEIRSARAGGGTILLTGTSMAAPHVAGAAALLLSIESDRTPAEVKAALVGRADPLNEEIMAQGGGRLNVHTAAGANIVTEPAALTFGNGPAGGWSAARTVRLINRGNTTQTFTTSFTMGAGVTITATPETFTLGPGATQEVAIAATLSESAQGAASTYALGGRVMFTSGQELVQVPWVAIDAGYARVTYDAPGYEVLSRWLCRPGFVVEHRSARPGSWGEQRTWSALLPYQTCDLTISAVRDGEITLLFESHQVVDNLDLQRSPEDSPHELQLAGVDDRGAVIAPESNEEAPYYASYTFAPRDGVGVIYSYRTWASGPLQFNRVSSDIDIIAGQVFFDFPNHRILAINHQPLNGLVSSMTLSSLPTDLRRATVEIAPQPGELELIGSVISSFGGSVRMFGSGASLRDGWRGEVFVTPDSRPRFWTAPALVSGRLIKGHIPALSTPAFRAFDSRVLLSNDRAPSPAAYGVDAGGTIAIGVRPPYPASFIDVRNTAFILSPFFTGPAGESVSPPGAAFRYALRDAGDMMLASGVATGFLFFEFGAGGEYSATVKGPGVELTLDFDTTRADWNPPTLTSLRIIGDDGLIAGRSTPLSVTLLFSVGDYVATFQNRGEYTGEIRSARASWRPAGGSWRDLPLELVSEDAGDRNVTGHQATGLHYRTDLSAVAGAARGAIDLQIETKDASGNRSLATLNNVFSSAVRLRPARR